MIEILLLLVFVLMARKARGSYRARSRRRGRMSRYLKGNVNETLTLTTLAALTLVSVPMDETVNERTYVSSILATWIMTKFTPGADDGPIMVGLAHSDYSDTEIEEYIETVGSWNEGDVVQTREVAKRMIRKVGVFRWRATDVNDFAILGTGRPIKTKLGWILNQGQTLKIWAYNMGSSALATTAPVVFTEGHANLWPR